MRTPTLTHLARASVLALGLGPLCCGNVLAATDAERIADLEQKLQSSLSQLQSLAARLSEIEKTKLAAATASSAPASTPEQESRIESLERNLAQITDAASRADNSSQGLPMHGFTDVGYVGSKIKNPDGRNSGFTLGNLDFYLTPQFGNNVKSLMELNFEWASDGSLTTDLERMQLGYTYNDELTVWVGRFHTPYGYWNTAFHHGAQLQTSVLRPRMIAFEDQGGILSAHSVGMWATGQTRAGDGKLGYDAYIANGSRIQAGIVDFNAVRDDNSNKMVGGNLNYRFGGAADGLVLGLHGYNEVVSAYDANGLFQSSSKVNMYGGYGFYDANDWEIISEYYGFHNNNLTGVAGNHSSWAGFLQVGKLLWGNTTPYARWEKAQLSATDNYFAAMTNGSSYTRGVLGVRYDLSPKTAVKVDVSHTRDAANGGENYNTVQAQFAVRF